MRVIVFGATSRLGRQVWRKALDAGHQVTVFGRLVKRLSEEEPALKTIMGDLIDAGAVPKAIARQDAVIVCLGTDYREENAEASACTNIIVNAMVRYDVKRLVVATTTEDGLYKDKTSKMDGNSPRLVARILPRFAAWAGTGAGSGVGYGGFNMYGGHAPQEDIIRDSPLDWTIVRAPRDQRQIGSRLLRAQHKRQQRRCRQLHGETTNQPHQQPQNDHRSEFRRLARQKRTTRRRTDPKRTTLRRQVRRLSAGSRSPDTKATLAAVSSLRMKGTDVRVVVVRGR